MGKYQKNIEAARRISVVQYLETYHPGELVRKTDKEYCTKTHSSLVITPANGLFHWFSQSKGGNNALDYLVKVEGMDFVSAVRLLNEMTPMPVSVQTVKEAPVQQQTSRPFVLPPADRNTDAVPQQPIQTEPQGIRVYGLLLSLLRLAAQSLPRQSHETLLFSVARGFQEIQPLSAADTSFVGTPPANSCRGAGPQEKFRESNRTACPPAQGFVPAKARAGTRRAGGTNSKADQTNQSPAP